MRLDNYLVEKGYFDSRTKAKQAIERGEIFVNNKKITKSAFEICSDSNIPIEYVYEKSYVSLGGYKLEKGLKDLNVDVSNLVVADIGASTGGFTDCLLQNGAKKVYAVDLNDNLLHQSLKQDSRVRLVVKNAKELKVEDFEDGIDFIVGDLSFISITQVIPILSKLIDKNKKALLLIKPQFETGGYKKFKNGIIRDEKIHKQVCDNIIEVSKCYSFNFLGITSAPISQDKNKEFLILLEKIWLC